MFAFNIEGPQSPGIIRQVEPADLNSNYEDDVRNYRSPETGSEQASASDISPIAEPWEGSITNAIDIPSRPQCANQRFVSPDSSQSES